MTEQEIITAAKTNWLAWQGLKELLPEVAAWMEAHKDKLVLFGSSQYWIERGKPNDAPCGDVVYRLRPDYEQLKWWFDTITKDVRQGSCAVHSACVEVTAEYADYLRTPVDGYPELRVPQIGDIICGTGSSRDVVVTFVIGDEGPDDRGYRWCKQKPDIAQLRRDLVEARARMMDATEAYLDAKHRLDGALRPAK
jgi:hypothetical protein